MKRKTKFMGRRHKRLIEEDPTEGLANLFDVAMVFAVGLMVAIVSYSSIPELLDSTTDVTLIKNPGTAEMEIINKQGETIEVLRATNESYGGAGRKLGTAYELPDGSIIYVPDDMDE